jgi:hypothetical protein
VKLVRTLKKQFIFSLGMREKHILFQILQMYPLVPPSHHRLSKTDKGTAHHEDQRLLEEAVAEQRRENRKQVMAMLEEPGRFRETKSDIQFSLTPAEIEWLLQVLNDVRVGGWLALGEPEELEPPEINGTNAPYILAMEAAGYFEAQFLAALGLHEPTQFNES